jgi:putative ABC transport system substrate-binding protein
LKLGKPELAADLVRRQVAVIVTPGGLASALAAKAATTTIPLIFVVATTRSGLVWSPASPDQTATQLELTSSQQSWLRNGCGL